MVITISKVTLIQLLSTYLRIKDISIIFPSCGFDKYSSGEIKHNYKIMDVNT